MITPYIIGRFLHNVKTLLENPSPSSGPAGSIMFPPLAVPVMLEIGRESVYGEANETLLAEAQAALVNEAMG
jgi:hypothetical protein